MEYRKPPLLFPDQVSRLKTRGLIISDDGQALESLSCISFYRLRAYTYPFQDNDDENHPFIEAVSINDIVALYEFDCKLRSLIFSAIERIEVALRTQIVYQWAVNHGSHWQAKADLYKDDNHFNTHIETLEKEIARSQEDFIKHYKQKYEAPAMPPAWMSLEVSSFGLLSKLFRNLKKEVEKSKVVSFFCLKDTAVLESWLYSFTTIRNICAHHARLWNRRLPSIRLPFKTINPFIVNKDVYTNKLYAALCCIQYLLNVISPACTFKQDLKSLIQRCPLRQEKAMGFPEGWLKEPFWQ